MTNNEMDGHVGQIEIARAIRGLRDEAERTVFELNRIANALERLAGPPREAACPECEGQNLSPDPLWYCRDCDLAHFGDSPSAFELRGVYRGNSLDKLD